MSAEPIASSLVLGEDGHLRLPDDAAEALQARLGHDLQPGDTVPVTLALVEDDDEFESWLRSEAVAAYDALHADPSSGIPASEVRARLDAMHAGRLASGS